MRINKFPTGYLEFENNVLTLGGGETVTVLAKDILSIEYRDGKKSIFSKNPPIILEITYKAGLGANTNKILIDKSETIHIAEFCTQIKNSALLSK